MTVQGYLADVAPPHIYRHVPERFHAVLHELAQPQTIGEAAAAAGYEAHYVRNHVCPRIKDDLGLTGHGKSDGWRVGLTRLYYGIDRCWCQR